MQVFSYKFLIGFLRDPGREEALGVATERRIKTLDLGKSISLAGLWGV